MRYGLGRTRDSLPVHMAPVRPFPPPTPVTPTWLSASHIKGLFAPYVLPVRGPPCRPLLRSPALEWPLLCPRGQQVPVRVVGHPDGPLLMHLDEQGGAGIGEGIERSRSRGGGWWCNTLLGHLEEQGVTREERE